MALPKTVYFVERIAPEDEPRKYYSKTKNRIYRNRQGISKYIKYNKGSEFRVHKAVVEWEDCTDEFTS